ncbi:hypothetical protein INR77_02945 [Erythrobacter sp. SCSIO 43205]|uniref:hypothetical protein n=1 Tax=Erythrobacter sp. SCSIO 43205 TaxID=2779361 RepID=UPI001CA9266C|nr:hypothetical protein [Erythrobacter sp. SCSIO 43205]UAB78701.1 hypothetical protein INR77_02945 [Erythrobacter sp. SCSIO 43205]
MRSLVARVFAPLLTLIALAWSTASMAAVEIHFHSFNGSVFGRYPHTFIVLDGTLEADGRVIKENYGFSAKSSTAAILNGWASHMVYVEKDKYIRKTNRHFSITLSDEQYHRIVAEMRAWRDEPGKRYSLDERNCIHFVGRMASILGLRVEFPENMLRRPKKWLNHITALNPQLGASIIK